MYLVDCFGIIYKIDTDHGNAEIISFDIDPDLVEIGYTINYNSKSYPITRIRNESKVKSEIESISFVDDSSVIALRKHDLKNHRSEASRFLPIFNTSKKAGVKKQIIL